MTIHGESESDRLKNENRDDNLAGTSGVIGGITRVHLKVG
jgi:hypothetical protein